MKFKKGQSGNPNGRPKKGTSMTDVLIMAVESMTMDERGYEIQVKKALSIKLIEMAALGEGWAMKYIFDRIDGTPKQTVDTTVRNSGNQEFDTSGMTEEEKTVLSKVIMGHLEAEDEE